jgi:hypothetical protein
LAGGAFCLLFDCCSEFRVGSAASKAGAGAAKGAKGAKGASAQSAQSAQLHGLQRRGPPPLPRNQRELFCSRQCWQRYNDLSGSRGLRRSVFERDHGVCELCAVDAHMLIVRLRQLSLPKPPPPVPPMPPVPPGAPFVPLPSPAVRVPPAGAVLAAGTPVCAGLPSAPLMLSLSPVSPGPLLLSSALAFPAPPALLSPDASAAGGRCRAESDAESEEAEAEAEAGEEELVLELDLSVYMSGSEGGADSSTEDEGEGEKESQEPEEGLEAEPVFGADPNLDPDVDGGANPDLAQPQSQPLSQEQEQEERERQQQQRQQDAERGRAESAEREARAMQARLRDRDMLLLRHQMHAAQLEQALMERRAEAVRADGRWALPTSAKVPGVARGRGAHHSCLYHRLREHHRVCPVALAPSTKLRPWSALLPCV